MFVVEYNLPKSYVWNPTFKHFDKQPFGCAIFDDVLTASLPQGYSVSQSTFYQLALDSVAPQGILVVSQQLDFVQADITALLQLAQRGNSVLLVASTFNKQLCDTLGFKHSHSWFRPSDLKKYAASFTARDSILWVSNPTYSYATYPFYPHLCKVYFTKIDSLSVPLSTIRIDSMQMHNDSLPNCFPAVAFRRAVGQGEIILASTPLVFTNYGMLDGGNATYLFRILSQLKGLPIIRTEAYGIAPGEQQSPFRYFLSQRALRWALYLAMSTMVLFLIFTARRKQRPIPVMAPPNNPTLEFTQLIGTLYYQKKNHTDLVCKKFTYFAETLRRTIQVDAEDDSNDGALCYKIAQKTGLDEQHIQQLFAALRPILRGEQNVREAEMKEYINRLNEIINHL